MSTLRDTILETRDSKGLQSIYRVKKALSDEAGPYRGPYPPAGAQFSCELFVTQGISSVEAEFILLKME